MSGTFIDLERMLKLRLVVARVVRPADRGGEAGGRTTSTRRIAARLRPVLVMVLFYSGCIVSKLPPNAQPPEPSSPPPPLASTPGPGGDLERVPLPQPEIALVPGSTYAYSIGPAPLDCPNWYASLRKARLRAGCDGSGRGDPANPCQIKLKECSACDVCQVLQPGQGPEVTIRRMEPSEI